MGNIGIQNSLLSRFVAPPLTIEMDLGQKIANQTIQMDRYSKPSWQDGQVLVTDADRS